MLTDDAWSFGPDFDVSRAEPDIIFHRNQTFALTGTAGSEKGTWNVKYFMMCYKTVLTLKFDGGVKEMDWVTEYTMSAMYFNAAYTTIPYMNEWWMWNNPKLN